MASSHGRTKREEWDAKRRATLHRKAYQKEYDAAYRQKNAARIAAYQKEYNANRRATPHRKAYQKEYQRRYWASPHAKAKRKDWDAKRRATPHRMATLHGKETTSGRLRAERGELLHCGKRKR